ncbi:binding protein ZnuC [Seminavis robusta]|uniref:Binding protein ZnuC n=1 Tax=Seminavis robusta TaxID=568900 RepID=A0A9N8HMY5_9STRA|nr:binding protein ZnuC [Seminavis robusta]|eukprot:Sro942_g222690.1 binding protein ZnuC (220) ;mRNA; f:28527-29186
MRLSLPISLALVASIQAFTAQQNAFLCTTTSTSTITHTHLFSSSTATTLEKPKTNNKNAPPTEDAEVYGTTVGDTKGAALRLENVAISRGASPLLNNIDWSVQPNERWGIVGVNGAGKSTLLGAITGTVRMDTGKALVHSNVRVGYLKQSAVSGSTKTVSEEARSEMTAVETARAQLEVTSKVVEDGDYSEEALEALAAAQEEFEALGGMRWNSWWIPS